MSRIASVFQRLREHGRKALIPFITAGYPEPAMSLPLMRALVEGGADIIELGVPFSDPMADGPTIQRASERALTYGISLRTVLAMVHEFRRHDDVTAIVLMGYANPIEAMGPDAFVEAARGAGVDGVLVVDYPPEECVDFASRLRIAGLDPIFLLAPTSSDERIAQIAHSGSGYIYYVSLRGVTGAGHIDPSEVRARISKIRKIVGLPVGVGFGIRDADSARYISVAADAIVIGSRIIEEIENSPREEAAARVGVFLRGIRCAMDEAPIAPGIAP